MNTYTVLIIDDNEEDRYILKRFLKSIDFVGTIYEASDGQEALDIFSDYVNQTENTLANFPPIFIFLDINMPFVGGIEFLERYSESNLDKHCLSTIIMMYTSSESEEDRHKVSTYSFVQDFISKGIHGTDEIKEKMLQIIANK